MLPQFSLPCPPHRTPSFPHRRSNRYKFWLLASLEAPRPRQIGQGPVCRRRGPSSKAKSQTFVPLAAAVRRWSLRCLKKPDAGGGGPVLPVTICFDFHRNVNKDCIRDLTGRLLCKKQTSEEHRSFLLYNGPAESRENTKMESAASSFSIVFHTWECWR